MGGRINSDLRFQIPLKLSPKKEQGFESLIYSVDTTSHGIEDKYWADFPNGTQRQYYLEVGQGQRTEYPVAVGSAETHNRRIFS